MEGGRERKEGGRGERGKEEGRGERGKEEGRGERGKEEGTGERGRRKGGEIEGRREGGRERKEGGREGRERELIFLGVYVCAYRPDIPSLVFLPQTLVYATVSEQLNSSGWQERLAACTILPMLHGPVTKVGRRGGKGKTRLSVSCCVCVCSVCEVHTDVQICS